MTDAENSSRKFRKDCQTGGLLNSLETHVNINVFLYMHSDFLSVNICTANLDETQTISDSWCFFSLFCFIFILFCYCSRAKNNLKRQNLAKTKKMETENNLAKTKSHVNNLALKISLGKISNHRPPATR